MYQCWGAVPGQFLNLLFGEYSVDIISFFVWNKAESEKLLGLKKYGWKSLSATSEERFKKIHRSTRKFKLLYMVFRSVDFTIQDDMEKVHCAELCVAESPAQGGEQNLVSLTVESNGFWTLQEKGWALQAAIDVRMQEELQSSSLAQKMNLSVLTALFCGDLSKIWNQRTRPK